MTKKRFYIAFIILLGSIKLTAQSLIKTVDWNILPKEHIVPIFTADTRAHRLGIHKSFNNNDYIAGMGGIFPVVAATKWNKTLQFSAASSVYTTLEKWTNKGQLSNIDFFVDLFFDLKLTDSWALRSSFGHTSQHLSDDALQKGLIPINYVRDYYQLFGIFNKGSWNLLCYAGYIYNNNFSTTVALSPINMFQIGFEHSPIKWKKNNFLYYAADVKWRGEFNYGTTQNVQVGYKYAQHLQHSVRFCVNYTSGYEERGQFYTKKRKLTTAGLYFDF